MLLIGNCPICYKYSNCLTLPIPMPDEERKFTWIFYFHTSLWCLIKPFEAPQRILKINIYRIYEIYFMYHSCVVIILFNTGLYKSAFPIDSLEKLVSCLSAVFALCQIRCNLHKLYNMCMIIICIVVGVRYSVFLFSLTF